ncbi:unnamed protein product [Pleuronectes platessa]|uniref:Ig-like domain-containing protein n=1 Tax=Pleuronectes platessa TaxID=8262 RepID=A0A9N7TV36_PLEPL|nr:unnamed protein product [Pleuronectes platessa]
MALTVLGALPWVTEVEAKFPRKVLKGQEDTYACKKASSRPVCTRKMINGAQRATSVLGQSPPASCDPLPLSSYASTTVFRRGLPRTADTHVGLRTPLLNTLSRKCFDRFKAVVIVLSAWSPPLLRALFTHVTLPPVNTNNPLAKLPQEFELVCRVGGVSVGLDFKYMRWMDSNNQAVHTLSRMSRKRFGQSPVGTSPDLDSYKCEVCSEEGVETPLQEGKLTFGSELES